MTSLLAVTLFVALVALLYFLLLSERSITMHRIDARQRRHDELHRELRPFSEARDTRSTAAQDDPDSMSTPGRSARKHQNRANIDRRS